MTATGCELSEDEIGFPVAARPKEHSAAPRHCSTYSLRNFKLHAQRQRNAYDVSAYRGALLRTSTKPTKSSLFDYWRSKCCSEFYRVFSCKPSWLTLTFLHCSLVCWKIVYVSHIEIGRLAHENVFLFSYSVILYLQFNGIVFV